MDDKHDGDPADGENLTGNDEMTNAGHQVRHESDMTPGARVATRRLLWSLIVLFIVTIAIGAANLLFTAQQVNNAHKQTLAACSFWQDLAGLPLPNAPGAKYPSLFGVTLVSHSRQAWHGSGCSGKIPPPSPSFLRGAKHYGVDPN